MGVTANSRSIVHSGDGSVNTAAPPDVCKTPSPGGPVPIPYVNIANDSDLAKGAKKVKIEGNPIGLESSNLSTSTGDEPGTAGGGIMSSKTKGKLTWGTSSSDVKAEGKGVTRFMDVAQHNGNSFNTVFTEMGGTGFAYGDDFTGKCPVCDKEADKHALLEKIEESLPIAEAILKDLNALEAAWKKADDAIASEDASLRKLVATDEKVKPATVEARKAKIRSLEETRNGLESHRRTESGGYMFGVLVCLTGKKFAAVSGGEMPPKFEEIARAHGCTPVKDPATLPDLQNANPRAAKGDAAARAEIQTRWDAAQDKHDNDVKGYNNAPGTCAGAKLMAKSGHVGSSMTEIFFAFASSNRSALTFSVIFRGPETLAPGKGPYTTPTKEQVQGATGATIVERRVDMRRKVDKTVASCQTCQDTLFMARCDLEEQKCG